MGCGASRSATQEVSDSGRPKAQTPPPSQLAAPASKPAERPSSGSTRPKPGSPGSAQGKPEGGNASTDPLAASKLGITLRGLRRLVEQLQKRFGPETFAAMSTADVMTQYVQPQTADTRCRFLELRGDMLDSQDVRPPQYFISHAWKNRAARLFSLVLAYLQDADADATSVWIDILAVNQHAGSEAQRHDVSPEAFGATVRACAAGTLVILDTEMCSPASRAWCIFEWTHTILLHGPDGLHLHLRPDDRAALLRSIDVEQAQCFKEEDKAMILAEVRKHHGTPQRFNQQLQLQLLLEPLSYTVDIRRLTEQAAATRTVWDFKPVDAWVAAGAGKSRVLCVAGGAGEGKSTVSAVLCGSGSTVAGYHFVKYNDERRLEPVRIVKSLAFQLAERLPVVSEHLLQLDVAAVATMTDPEEAVKTLLLPPLEKYQQQRPEVLVLLIDALDEADPQALQADAATAAAAGGGRVSGAGGRPRPACPTVCGNRVLQLLVAGLKVLPPCVRFIVTTRPEAAAGQVLPCLERSFPGGVTIIKPSALRKPTSAAQSRATSASGATGGGGSGGGGGNLVYHAAAAALQHVGGSAPPPRPAPSLDDVYDLYGKVFEVAYGKYGAGQGTQVTELLEVLLAAREPLSQSFLQQLGLGAAVQLLPGHPRLFFLDEHHVYAVHKSLGDWLLNTARSGRFTVQLRRGHERIGLHLARSCWKAATAAVAAAAVNDSVATSTYMLPYTLKYVIGHLAAGAGLTRDVAADSSGAARQSANGGAPPDTAGPRRSAAGNSSRSSSARGAAGATAAAVPTSGAAGAAAALDGLLSDFAFLQAAAAAGHIPAIIGVLSDLRDHSACSYDALRWLQAEQFNLAGKSAVAAAAHALATVPVRTKLFAAACRATAMPWRTRAVVPDPGGWTTFQAVLKAHPDKVRCVAFSPDGRQLATCGEDDPLIRIWITATGRPSAQLPGHSGATHAAAFSPDGRQLASGGADGAVRLWDAATGQVASVLSGHSGDVRCVSYSADGKYLASGGEDNKIRVWDLTAAGECISTLDGHCDTVRCLAFSPHGFLLASGSEDTTVRLWTFATGECTANLSDLYDDDVNGVAFNAGGDWLVSCASDGKVVRYDILKEESETVMELQGGEVKCVAFTADGKHLITGDQVVRLWDTETWEYAGNLTGGMGYVQSVAASPDGRWIAAGRSDVTVRLWEVAAGWQAPAPTKMDKDVVRSLAFNHPEGEQLATGGRDGVVRVYDGTSGGMLAELRGHAGPVLGVAYSPTEAKQLASAGADGTVRVWDSTPPLVPERFWMAMMMAPPGSAPPPGGPRCFGVLEGHEGAVRCVAYSPDGKRIASGGKDGTVRLWDTDGPRAGDCVATMEGHTGQVHAVAFRADGLALASASEDKTVRLWAGGKCMAELTGHTGPVYSLAFRPPGGAGGAGGAGAGSGRWLLLSGGDDKSIRVWDPSAATPTAAAAAAAAAAATACVAVLQSDVRISPGLEELTAQHNTTFLAIQESMDSMFRGKVFGLAFSPDGSVLASADNDEFVRLWDPAVWACKARLPGHKEATGGVMAVAFSPNGKRMASGGCDEQIRIWERTAG